MDTDQGRRYTVNRTLRDAWGRWIATATDRLTGEPVILKTAPLPFSLREARCLLALPASVGPAVRALVWDGAGALTLVLEHLEGQPLADAAAGLPVEEIPRLAQAICHALAHVHRTGWIHADLSPSNVLVAGHGNGLGVRLVDLGFAIDRFGGAPEESRGGTVPFVAPEVQRGWMADGRADLYSLGMMLRHLFPALRADARWTPILASLCAEMPARRPAHTTDVAEEIARIFDLPATPGSAEETRPRLGTGPAQGRAESLESLVRLLAGGSTRVLVQARPGIGLSRFLREAVLAVAANQGPAVRALDVGDFRDPSETTRALDQLVDLAEAPGAILCGVNDPSPGLHWTAADAAERLRFLVKGEWARLTLSPLEAEDHVELVSAALGTRDVAAEQLAHALHDRCEGDLTLAEEEFRRCVEQAGTATGAAWKLDSGALRLALDDRPVMPRTPRLKEVPSALVSPLRLCAQAGQSFPARLAGDLVGRFAEPDDLEALLDHGYLRPDPGERLAFVTRALRQEAADMAPEAFAAIDRWLHVSFSPDPDRVEEVIQACLRARRLGDQSAESERFSAAFTRATQRHVWPDLLRLAAYPRPTAPPWTSQFIRDQASVLSSLLGPDWSEAMVLVWVALAVQMVAPEVGVQTLESATHSPDVQAVTAAHLILMGLVVDVPADVTFDDHVAALEALGTVNDGHLAGWFADLLARRAFCRGRVAEAERHATNAAARLRGSGRYEEGLNLQIIAILRFDQDPGSAIATMRAALEATVEPALSAQLRINLAIMHECQGQFEESARCTDEGIRELHGRITSLQKGALRLRRTAAWVGLDRIAAAQQELLALLQLSAVRLRPTRRSEVRLLLADCLLRSAHNQASMREFASIWLEMTGREQVTVVRDCLNALADAILDVGAWDIVGELRATFPTAPIGETPDFLVAHARAQALLAQADGRPEDAARLLEDQLDAARGLSVRLATARYLHHLGLVRLELALRGAAGVFVDAVACFEEALGALVPKGHDYHRGRALLGLATARFGAGDRRGADDALGRAISLARRIEAPGLLTDCLRERGRGIGE